jgi:Ca2+-binding RTX toxin-like protein
VIALGADGSMQVADHVIDTLDTRFQGVQALATAQIGDRVFVIAGGGDDGLTVMVLTPEGRLLACGQMLQAAGPGIGQHHRDDRAGHGRDDRAVRHRRGHRDHPVADRPRHADADPAGRAGGRDVLSGTTGADMILGGDGDEVVQGGRAPTSWATARAATRCPAGRMAIFSCCRRMAAYDRIADFQLGIDRIDLSAWGRIHSLAALRSRPRRRAR